RPRSNVPFLESFDDVSLPASLRLSDQRQNNNVIEVSETFSARRGRSAWNAGFQYRRNIENGISLGLESLAQNGTVFLPDGFYVFPSLEYFKAGTPVAFALAVDRGSSGNYQLPDLHRNYRS